MVETANAAREKTRAKQRNSEADAQTLLRLMMHKGKRQANLPILKYYFKCNDIH